MNDDKQELQRLKERIERLEELLEVDPDSPFIREISSELIDKIGEGIMDDLQRRGIR